MCKIDDDISKYIDENLYDLVKEIVERDNTGEVRDEYLSPLLKIKSMIESSSTSKDYHGFRSIEQLIIKRALDRFIDEGRIKLNSMVDVYNRKGVLVGTTQVVDLSGLTATIKFERNTLFFDITRGRYEGRQSEYCQFYIKKKPRD